MYTKPMTTDEITIATGQPWPEIRRRYAGMLEAEVRNDLSANPLNAPLDLEHLAFSIAWHAN